MTINIANETYEIRFAHGYQHVRYWRRGQERAAVREFTECRIESSQGWVAWAVVTRFHRDPNNGKLAKTAAFKKALTLVEDPVLAVALRDEYFRKGKPHPRVIIDEGESTSPDVNAAAGETNP